MKLLLHLKRYISLLFGITFFSSPASFVYPQNDFKQIKNYKFHASTQELVRLDDEYQKLELFRNKEPRTLWLNTERENQIEFEKPKIFISLGMNCGPARQFDKKNLTEAFFPFDWCVSEFESIYKALATDFEDYLKEENLEILEHPSRAKHRFIRDNGYNITYLHDFSLDGEALHDYEYVKNKYFRRIERFYKALNLGKKVYFFRTSITKKETIKLNNLIQAKFPKLNYKLVVLNETKEFKKQWKIKNVKNFFLPGCKEAMMDNSKMIMNGWDDLFADLKIIKKRKPTRPPLTPLQKKRSQG